MDAAIFSGGEKGTEAGRFLATFLPCSRLNPFTSPSSTFKVPPRQSDQDHPVNVFGEPADSHIRLEPDDAVINGGGINGQGNHLHDEACLCISRAGYGVKQNKRRGYDQGGGGHHVHGIDTGGNQGRVIRENSENGLREHAQEDQQGNQDGVRQVERHAAGLKQVALFPGADLVADEGSRRGAEGADYHNEHGGNVAHDVGDGQGAFSQMLNRQEKDEPDGDGNEGLHHGPAGNGQHAFQQMGAERERPAEAVLPFIRRRARINDEKEEGYGLRHTGGNCRSGNAHGRKAAFPEDEAVIQHHVAQKHHDGIDREDLCLGNPHVIGAEHHAEEGEKNAVGAPVQVIRRSAVHLGGFNDIPQDDGGKVLGCGKKRHRQDQHEITALDHGGGDAVVPPLPVAACDNDLRPEPEAEGQHEHGHVIHAAQGARSQRHIPHASQENGVRQADQVLNDQADHQGIGHEPYLLIGNRGRTIHSKGVLRASCAGSRR